MDWSIADRSAIEQNLARVEPFEAGNDPKQGGFSAAAWAQEA
jgi:hypothetical protein